MILVKSKVLIVTNSNIIIHKTNSNIMIYKKRNVPKISLFNGFS